MKRVSLVKWIMAALLIMVTPIYGQDANMTVATVDGEEIKLGHIIALTNSLPDNYAQLPDETLYNGLLDQIIRQILMAKAVNKENKHYKFTLENEERAIGASIMMQQIMDRAVENTDINAFYQQQIKNEQFKPEFRAAHILVKTKEEANTLIKKLNDGADFSELAKENSTGPSGANGGDLGWFKRGDMVPEFDQAVTNMEKGAISTPVETQFGWHVIKLNDKRDYPDFDSVRDALAQQIRDEALQKSLLDMEMGATIKKSEPDFDFNIIRDTSLLAK